MVTQRRVRLGQLLDFADSLPPASIETAIIDLFNTANQHRLKGSKRCVRLRYYVILGALITKLLFDIEGLDGGDWL